MNPQLLQYFMTGKLYNFSWVLLLFFANDYIKTDRIIAIICVVGAIALAALEVMHKSKEADTLTTKNTQVEDTSSSNSNESE